MEYGEGSLSYLVRHGRLYLQDVEFGGIVDMLYKTDTDFIFHISSSLQNYDVFIKQGFVSSQLKDQEYNTGIICIKTEGWFKNMEENKEKNGFEKYLRHEGAISIIKEKLDDKKLYIKYLNNNNAISVSPVEYILIYQNTIKFSLRTIDNQKCPELDIDSIIKQIEPQYDKDVIELKENKVIKEEKKYIVCNNILNLLVERGALSIKGINTPTTPIIKINDLGDMYELYCEFDFNNVGIIKFNKQDMYNQLEAAGALSLLKSNLNPVVIKTKLLIDIEKNRIALKNLLISKLKEGRLFVYSAIEPKNKIIVRAIPMFFDILSDDFELCLDLNDGLVSRHISIGSLFKQLEKQKYNDEIILKCNTLNISDFKKEYEAKNKGETAYDTLDALYLNSTLNKILKAFPNKDIENKPKEAPSNKDFLSGGKEVKYAANNTIRFSKANKSNISSDDLFNLIKYHKENRTLIIDNGKVKFDISDPNTKFEKLIVGFASDKSFVIKFINTRACRLKEYSIDKLTSDFISLKNNKLTINVSSWDKFILPKEMF